MNSKELKVYGQIQALVVESKGMEAENQYCVQGGEYPVYTQDHFREVAAKIRDCLRDVKVNLDPQGEPIQYDTNFQPEDLCLTSASIKT